MKPAITLDQVLAITYTSGHAWSPDGRHLGFIYDDGGRYSLRVADIAIEDLQEVSTGDEAVTAFAWAPDGRIAYVQDGRVIVASPAAGRHEPNGRDGEPDHGEHDGWSRSTVYQGTAPATAVDWAPKGQALAFVAGGRL